MRRFLVVVLGSLLVVAGCRDAGDGQATRPKARSTPSTSRPPTASTPVELDLQTAQDQHLLTPPPDLALVAPQSARAGDPIRRYVLRATDSDSACADLRFSAVGLPVGLAVANNGDCTATVGGKLAARAGRYAVTYTVIDESGNSDSTTSVFTVAVPPP
ncbi:MAG TPA: hypothetical protein VG276_29075 [Actinomycetes bacterium]|nr:hypothetical protein [Actinomycetes bacterium]